MHDPKNKRLVLDDDTIDIWCLSLKQNMPSYHHIIKTLSADELKKAAFYQREKEKENYIMRRIMLRTILSWYVHSPPASLQFDYSHHGKPFIKTSKAIEFNLSYSDHAAIFAITKKHAIGIDLEPLDPDIKAGSMGNIICAKREKETLLSLNQQEQHVFFYHLWTGKEAFIKALGVGFAFDVKACEFNYCSDKKRIYLDNIAHPAYAAKTFHTIKLIPYSKQYIAHAVIHGPKKK